MNPRERFAAFAAALLPAGSRARLWAGHLAREPLAHFLMAGALLFVAYAWLNAGADNATGTAARTVRITVNEVEWLKQTWARQWQRPPNEDELKRLVTGYLKEELLAREARALKLDENDTIVRRRLAQKMEFMVQDIVQLADPDEAALRQVYDANRERFQSPARISFSHVYFNRDRRGARTEADARAALRQLSQAGGAANVSALGESASGASVHRGPRLDPIGDRLLVPYDFTDVEEQAVASVLGQEFARQVFALPAGTWQGPVESGYGLHLVRVAKKQPALAHDFATAKAEVMTLWRQQREEQGREQYFAALLNKYDVVADESVKPLLGSLSVMQTKAAVR